MTAADAVTVGGLTVPRADALRQVRDYLQDGTRYAYPAYDTFDGGAGGDELSDGDLLAYALLNVPPRLPAYYSLRAARPRLVEWLRATPADVSLAEAGDAEVDRLGELYSILDGPGLRGVGGTILAKVMHRKRPLLVPLYDRFVFRVYAGHPAAPLTRVRGRSWAEFMPLLARAIGQDLRGGASFFTEAASQATVGPVTPLRALDIVAWDTGRRLGSSPGEPDDDPEAEPGGLA